MNNFENAIEAAEYLSSIMFRSKFNPDLALDALRFIDDPYIIAKVEGKIEKQKRDVAHRAQMEHNHKVGRYFIKKHREDILTHLKQRDGDFCQRCKKQLQMYDIDHIIPLKEMGDPESYDNLQLMCPRCNRIKGER